VGDVLNKRQRSYCMSRIRGRDTGPEIVLRRALWALGLRYRLANPLPGKPDLVFVRERVSVFVDGCFWHGCPDHGARPKTNKAFWHRKLSANLRRDRRVERQLRANGWRVIRVWEHEIRRDAEKAARRVYRRIRRP
jgi:DNA mismatch endonuclease (patch repair protein)